MCSEIQDGGKVCRADQGRIVSLSEKATPENTEKTAKYGVKILNGKFTKMMKYFK